MLKNTISLLGDELHLTLNKFPKIKLLLGREELLENI
jgi:hypothetical protein